MIVLVDLGKGWRERKRERERFRRWVIRLESLTNNDELSTNNAIQKKSVRYSI